MQLIELQPIELGRIPGFSASVAKLRAEAELPLFADYAASYDIPQYQALYELGYLSCVAVHDAEGELRAWGVLMTVPTPRRDRTMYNTDAMWSDHPHASFLLLRRFIKIADGAPIIITASIGGRLDHTLSNSKMATKTHHVHTLHARP